MLGKNKKSKQGDPGIGKSVKISNQISIEIKFETKSKKTPGTATLHVFIT